MQFKNVYIRSINASNNDLSSNTKRRKSFINRSHISARKLDINMASQTPKNHSNAKINRYNLSLSNKNNIDIDSTYRTPINSKIDKETNLNKHEEVRRIKENITVKSRKLECCSITLLSDNQGEGHNIIKNKYKLILNDSK